MEQKKKNIGITGGVGAGKSSVLAVLKENFGGKIILADLVAHELMEPGSEGLKKVTEALGTSFLAQDGSVDRKALADVIFRNKDALRTMNSIIHPLVWKTMKEAAEAAEEHLPAAALLEARDGHHHMLQTSSRGILSEISCHGTLLLSKQKSGSCLCCTVCADAAPAFSDVTYQFVAPVLVPAPVCPPDLGQCIRSLSLRSAWL